MSDGATFFRQVNERGTRSVATGVVERPLSIESLAYAVVQIGVGHPVKSLGRGEGEPLAMRFMVGRANNLHQDL